MAGNPEKCFMVGDNPQSDIKGALGVGIPAILVHNNDAQGFDCAVCENLSDMIGLI